MIEAVTAINGKPTRLEPPVVTSGVDDIARGKHKLNKKLLSRLWSGDNFPLPPLPVGEPRGDLV